MTFPKNMWTVIGFISSLQFCCDIKKIGVPQAKNGCRALLHLLLRSSQYLHWHFCIWSVKFQLAKITDVFVVCVVVGYFQILSCMSIMFFVLSMHNTLLSHVLRKIPGTYWMKSMASSFPLIMNFFGKHFGK
jgi:hypothetical protein